MPTLYKEYTVPAGTYVSETFIYAGFNLGANPAPPAWFSFVDGPVLIGIQTFTGYSFTAPPQIRTYDIPFIDFLGGNWYIRINVTIGQYVLTNNCCGDRNISWLNIQGGWQNYIFNGVKAFTVDMGKDKRYKTSSLVLKKSQVSDVYNGEIISTGDIPKSHVDILAGLTESIQAFLFNDDTGAWDIPIIIDAGSFTKYKSRDKFFEVKLKFMYAEEILIQTQ